MTDPAPEISAAIAVYEAARWQLHALVKARFPIGSVVIFGSGDRVQRGIVHSYFREKPSGIDIEQENGIVSTKRVTHIAPAPDRARWPEWVRARLAGMGACVAFSVVAPDPSVSAVPPQTQP